MGDLSSNTYFAISTNTDSHSFFFYYYFYVVTVVLYHSLTWAEEPGPQSMVEPLVELLCGRLMDRSRGYRQKDLVEVPLCASPRAWILFLSLLPVFPILPKVAGCGCRVLPAALLVLITNPPEPVFNRTLLSTLRALKKADASQTVQPWSWGTGRRPGVLSVNQQNKALLLWQNLFKQASGNTFPSFPRDLLNSRSNEIVFLTSWVSWKKKSLVSRSSDIKAHLRVSLWYNQRLLMKWRLQRCVYQDYPRC